MPLDPNLRAHIAARIRYYRELGIYDLYRREITTVGQPITAVQDERGAPPKPSSGLGGGEDDSATPGATPKPGSGLGGKEQSAAELLHVIRADLGDCTRCVLHKQGRKQLVFGVGTPHAELMFVGEGPGADEDEQGEPFVGRAGQLLNKMIAAMGLRREDAYIANVVKCRPPGNRTPEKEECDTCSPFLMRQIDAIRPKVIVALGAVAAKNLLGLNESMATLRGRVYDYRGSKLVVTYHPAFLLRDPRQKGEAWKDLQIAMSELDLPIPKKSPS